MKPKSIILLTIILCFNLLTSLTAKGQVWKWAIGSINPERIVETWPITVDPSGNIYEASEVFDVYGFYDPADVIIGSDTISTSAYYDYQLLLVSSDSNGIFRWGIVSGGVSATMINIASDPCDNVYLMGSYNQGTFTLGSFSVSNSSVNYKMYFLAKINSNGNVIWLKNIAQQTSIYSTAQNLTGGLSIDGDGNPYVAGSFNGPGITIGGAILLNSSTDTNTSDVFVAKYDTSGTLIWANRFGGDSSEYVYGVSVTKKGDVYISGYFYSDTLLFAGDTLLNPSGGVSASLYVAKYDKYGTPKWAKGSAGTTTNVSINEIATDNWNSVYMVGAYRNSFSFGAVTMPYITGILGFIMKFDSSGNAKWENTLSGTINSINTWGVTTDNNGNIWTCGDENGTETPLDLMSIAQYDTSGALIRSLSLTDGGDDQNGVAVDNRGNLYVGGDYMHNPFILAGSTLYTTGFGIAECLFIAKYSYPFVALPPDTLPSIQICRGDSTILNPPFPCGTWSSSNSLIAMINSTTGLLTGISPGTTTITYRGAGLSYDIETVKVNPLPIVSFSDTGTRTVGFDYTGSTTGIDSIVWNFGDGSKDTGMITFHTYATSNIYQVCVTAYTPLCIDSSCKHIKVIGLGVPILSLVNMQVFPNPANTQLTIKTSVNITTIAITNLLGQTVYNYEFNSNEVKVDVADLPAGVYFVKVNGVEVRKFVKE